MLSSFFCIVRSVSIELFVRTFVYSYSVLVLYFLLSRNLVSFYHLPVNLLSYNCINTRTQTQGYYYESSSWWFVNSHVHNIIFYKVFFCLQQRISLTAAQIQVFSMQGYLQVQVGKVFNYFFCGGGGGISTDQREIENRKITHLQNFLCFSF